MATENDNSLFLETEIIRLRKANKWLRFCIVLVGWIPLATNAMWIHSFHHQHAVTQDNTHRVEELDRQVKEYGAKVHEYSNVVHNLEDTTQRIMGLCHVRTVSYQ